MQPGGVQQTGRDDEQIAAAGQAQQAAAAEAERITARSTHTVVAGEEESCAVCLCAPTGFRSPCPGTPGQCARRLNERLRDEAKHAHYIVDLTCVDSRRGLAAYCLLCGAYGSRVMRRLGAECPRRVPAGRKVAAADAAEGWLPGSGRSVRVDLGF